MEIFFNWYQEKGCFVSTNNIKNIDAGFQEVQNNMSFLITD